MSLIRPNLVRFLPFVYLSFWIIFRCQSILITFDPIRNFDIHFLFCSLSLAHFQLRIDTLRITRIDWARFFNSKLVIVPMLIKFSSAFKLIEQSPTRIQINHRTFDKSTSFIRTKVRNFECLGYNKKNFIQSKCIANNIDGAMNEDVG